jgi:predicted Fe-S protein YdhL (DUF1289 family)
MSNVTVIAPRTRHSPCVGICKLDERSGHCLGCARTGDEIGRWSGMSEAQRDAIWTMLPARHEALAITMRLTPWMPDEIGAWVARTLSEGLGTWTTGVPGALAEFPCQPEALPTVTRDGDAIVGRAPEAAIRLTVHDKLRAFASGRAGPIVLGWPKARGAMSVATTFTPLGPDAGAVEEAHRGHHLFDIGLGRQASRFCIRTDDADLIATLTALAGRPWPDVMREAGMAIFSAYPHRVVESRLARVEVYGPIPLPGSPSPAGAHTHFLPEFLKTGEEAPSGLMPPDYAWPVAIFYPGGGLA